MHTPDVLQVEQLITSSPHGFKIHVPLDRIYLSKQATHWVDNFKAQLPVPDV